jgi:type VI protein secretion system component VasK
VVPSVENKNNARLIVDGETVELSGGRAVRVTWPKEGQGRAAGASLKIQVSKDFWQDITMNGQWGFMKLLNAGRINKINSNTFTVKWQLNVQNMYMVYLEARMQVATADHPFTDQLFQNFDCPDNVIVEKREK